MAALLITLLVLLALAQGSLALPEKDSIFWVKLHGWTCWASFGFLFPLGIIIIRFTKPVRNARHTYNSVTIWALFYLHVVIQVLAVLLSAIGVAVLIVQYGANFDYTHQRLGIALCGIMWLQPFIGFIRPQRGARVRPFWYGIHWVLGTGAIFLGVVNTYIGIEIYEKYVARTSIRTLNILFGIQISVMCLVYLLQDRWGYMWKQGKISKQIQSFSL